MAMAAASSSFLAPRADALVGPARRGARRVVARRPLTVAASKGEVTLLDYGAGNVRSVRNAIMKLGFTVKDVTTADEIMAADRLIFPGVGAYGSAMDILKQRGLVDPLREYCASGKPFMACAWVCSSCSTAPRSPGAWRAWGSSPGWCASSTRPT